MQSPMLPTPITKRIRKDASTCDSSVARLTDKKTFEESAAELEAVCNTTARLLFALRLSPGSYFSVAPADVSASVLRFVTPGCLRIDKVRDEVITLKISALIARAGLNTHSVIRAHAFYNGSIIQFLTKNACIVVMRIADGVVTKRIDISTLACTHIEDPHREGFSTRQTFLTCNGVVINVCTHCHEATVYWLGTVVALVDDDIVFGVTVKRKDSVLTNVYVTESLKVITACVSTTDLYLVDINTGSKTYIREEKLSVINIYGKELVMSVDATEKYICIWRRMPGGISDRILVYSLSKQRLLFSYESTGHNAEAIDCNGTVIGATQVFDRTGEKHWTSVSIQNIGLSADILSFPISGLINSYHVTDNGRLMCLTED